MCLSVCLTLGEDLARFFIRHNLIGLEDLLQQVEDMAVALQFGVSIIKHSR